MTGGNIHHAGGRETILLLVLPLPIFEVAGTLWLDTQACNGLRLWLEHFDRVILGMPLQTPASPPPATSKLRDLLPMDRLEIETFPSAYTPIAFARTYRSMAARLKALIARSTHRQFAIGGLWGDWGALGALIAARMGKPSAVWTDRVESNVMRISASRLRGLKRIYHSANAWGAKLFEAHVIRRSALGLFHGMDTYQAYADFSFRPELVHDVHLGPESRIPADQLAAKIARDPAAPLDILYAGRAHPDKGILDWVETLGHAAARGVRFRATWFGDGPDWEAARARVHELGLEALIALPGSIDDRAELLRRLWSADIFLFCHKTLESPRCLVEALLAGSPIVGYDSAYPRDLISAQGGGVLTRHDPEALAAELKRLDEDRAGLSDLKERAAADGHPMIDIEVFRHRSDLIKTL